MAREHVYPVCSPNLLEFSKENTLSIFPILQASLTNRLFYTDGSWGQLLIGEASNEEWKRDGADDGRGYFLIGFTEGYSDSPLLDPPPAGTVICVGIKDRTTSTFDNFYTGSRVSLIPSPLIGDEFGTKFDNASKSGTDISVVFANPFWTTYMWDGNRWQILGSNNWV